jgi:hypothetical protein
MSTVLTPAARQERLFGEAGLATPPGPPPPEPRPPSAPAFERTGGVAAPPARRESERAAPATPSLHQAIAGLWDDLLAGEPAPCPVCGETMEPRESAGAGVDGGACPSCGSSLV